MAQVSGVWVWNDSLPFAETAVAEYNLTFKSGNDNYTSLYVHDSDYDPRGGALLAYGSSGNAVYIGSGLETGFTNEVYKTIDFGTTPQTVSDNFYTYLTANATTTSTEQKAISLSNLEKFKELCDQTYAKTGGSGGGTQLYRHKLSFNSASTQGGYITLISTSNIALANGGEIYSHWNEILAAFYGPNAATYWSCLFIDDDMAVVVNSGGVETVMFPPSKLWRNDTVTPL